MFLWSVDLNRAYPRQVGETALVKINKNTIQLSSL